MGDGPGSSLRSGIQRMAGEKIPASVRRLFWEYGDREIRWPEDASLIIRKVLQDGTWDDLRWLRGKIGDEGIRRRLLRHEGGGLDRRRLSFWRAVLDLPEDQVNAWMKRLENSPWERRYRE